MFNKFEFTGAAAWLCLGRPAGSKRLDSTGLAKEVCMSLLENSHVQLLSSFPRIQSELVWTWKL